MLRVGYRPAVWRRQPGRTRSRARHAARHADSADTPGRSASHLFRASLLTASKIGSGVDTKGHGGYIVLAPSHVEADQQGDAGGYAVETAVPIAPLPECIARLAHASREHRAASDGIEPDAPQNIDRFRQMLKHRAGAIEGQGGDSWTFEVACLGHDFGLSEGATAECMRQWNREKCIPPWSDDELCLKVTNAFEYSQNAWGCDAQPAPSAIYAGVDLSEFDEPETKTKRSAFHVFSYEEFSQFMPQSWAIEPLFTERSLVLFPGRYSSFKTFALLDLSHGIAPARIRSSRSMEKGRSCSQPVRRPTRWRGSAGAPFATIAILTRTREIPFYLVKAVPVLAERDQREEFIGQIELALGSESSAIFLDTAAKAMRGQDQNSATDVGLLAQAAEMLRDHFDCTVGFTHHAGWQNTGRGKGATTFYDDFDHVLFFAHDEATGVVTIEDQKSRDEIKHTHAFRPKVLPVPDLVGATSVVIDWLDDVPAKSTLPAKDAAKASRRARIVQQVEAALDELECFPGGSREWRSVDRSGGIEGHFLAEHIIRAQWRSHLVGSGLTFATMSEADRVLMGRGNCGPHTRTQGQLEAARWLSRRVLFRPAK